MNVSLRSIAILKLCARPQGFKNIDGDRLQGHSAKKINDHLRRLIERNGWVVAERKTFKDITYRITAKGLRVLSKPDTRVQLGWTRTPKSGSIKPTPRKVTQKFVSCPGYIGFDKRVQVGPDFEGGLYTAEWRRLRG